MEFIADSDIRANLGVELAKCYAEEGNFLSARRELNESIPNLPAGDIAVEANLLLAEVCVELKDYVRVEIVCDQIRSNSNEPHIEKKISSLLGKMYMTINEPEKAALAYAGIYGITGAE